MNLSWLVNLILVFASRANGYNNGQGLHPAMGWNSWCSVNQCSVDICNEDEVRQAAMAMKSNGMYDVGYRHINVDDCWEACSRDANGNIQPDPNRFPSGIKNLTDFIHSLDLTFGLYTSAGNNTCKSGDRSDCRVPGSYGYYTQDAQTFADWGVDFVKMDWCGIHGYNATQLHTEFSKALNATGRSIWFELCRGYNWDPTSSYVAQVANSWRVYKDHRDDWSSTQITINGVINNNKLSGKYNWAYLDFLMTGGEACGTNITNTNVTSHCPGMTDTEYITEFSMWVITASPLIVATDIRNMTNIMNTVLLNTEIIEINQENETPGGNLIETQNCELTYPNKTACQIWTRKMSDGSIATILFNAGNFTHTFGITFDKLNMNWNEDTVVSVRDLWKQENLGDYTGYYNNTVDSHAVSFVRMYENSFKNQINMMPNKPKKKRLNK